MDILFVILGIVLLLFGIIGCFLPVIPGPPLNYLSIIVLHFTKYHDFSQKFLIIWGATALLVTVLDYFIPPIITKKYGGSKYGVRGSIIGIFIGILLFPPVGIIIGPIIGAFVGEVMYNQSRNKSFTSAFGSFLGVLIGSLMKLLVSVFLSYHYIKNIIA
ncbi:MAG TPA: DUF456 domain-containing protein [Cyclobacteriaceae bacterium]